MMSTESRGAEQMNERTIEWKHLKTGEWYYLYRPNSNKPYLSYCYFSIDHRCTGFGLNQIQGGGFIPIDDIEEGTRIVGVEIVERDSIGESSPYKNYLKCLLQPMRPYIVGEDLSNISISTPDIPGEGGMIAVNPNDPKDQWYVAKRFFEDNYELAEEQ